MAGRRVVTRQFRQTSKRQTDWAFSLVAVASVNVPANSKVLLASITSAALAFTAPSTIVRTRGIIAVGSDQAAASEFQLGGFGVSLASETARALGITALDGPSSDPTSDRWFVHQFIAQRFDVNSAMS